MKRLLFFSFALMLELTCLAQKDVTKFLGIPVDGTKSAMIQKLKDKGFTYDYRRDILEGEFNGREVELSVVTNNNKVYRIMVMDAIGSDEAQIKIKFNNLCRQFENNKRYTAIASVEDFIIPDNEKISYEITIHKKSYQAAFVQVPNNEEGLLEGLKEYAKTKVTKEEYDELSESEKKHLYELVREDYINHLKEAITMKLVWFTIVEQYGRYYICMYYDNQDNQAHGEDL